MKRNFPLDEPYLSSKKGSYLPKLLTVWKSGILFPILLNLHEVIDLQFYRTKMPIISEAYQRTPIFVLTRTQLAEV